MIKYSIVEVRDRELVLASCSTLKKAKQYLKDIKKTDKYLQKQYNWSKLPKYLIKEELI
jgi:hypothetical protein